MAGGLKDAEKRIGTATEVEDPPDGIGAIVPDEVVGGVVVGVVGPVVVVEVVGVGSAVEVSLPGTPFVTVSAVVVGGFVAMGCLLATSWEFKCSSSPARFSKASLQTGQVCFVNEAVAPTLEPFEAAGAASNIC